MACVPLGKKLILTGRYRSLGWADASFFLKQVEILPYSSVYNTRGIPSKWDFLLLNKLNF